MDPLTQGTLGSALAQSAADPRQIRGFALAGAGGGIVPDLDILIRSDTDPILYLEFHRQFSHSLVFIPIGAALCALLLHPVLKRWLSLKEIHLVMEFCEGKSVQENRPQSVEQVVQIFSKVAGGLAHMNSRGYVHADTKPNNIIVAADGEVKIIDLGQSCHMGTIKQRIQGTPDFIAPEQVRRLPLDARTDIYNFGASLYWGLSGQAIPACR